MQRCLRPRKIKPQKLESITDQDGKNSNNEFESLPKISKIRSNTTVKRINKKKRNLVKKQPKKQIHSKSLFKNPILNLPALLMKLPFHEAFLTKDELNPEKYILTQNDNPPEEKKNLKRKFDDMNKTADLEMEEITNTLKKLKIQDASEANRIKKAEKTKEMIENILLSYRHLQDSQNLEEIKKEMPTMVGKINSRLFGFMLQEKIKLNLLYCFDVSFSEEDLEFLKSNLRNEYRYKQCSGTVDLFSSIIADKIQEYSSEDAI